MSRTHANISVFVPHLGCPNMCSFCNQRYIAGTAEVPDEQTVINAVKLAVESKNYNPETTEIAFFGGSFTAIDREYMLRLLKAAHRFVQDGTVSGIRISTRPDFIDDEILTLLKEYGVTSIELGAQSMCDEVLKSNNRGHTSDDVRAASRLIKSYDFGLGLQMMTGLYGDTDSTAIFTAHEIIKLDPDTVRIYPTIVLENTRLSELYRAGEYKPQSLEAAVDLAATLLCLFKDAGIHVIRTGLHTIDTQKYVAGPWHPAFRELCDSKIYLREVLKQLHKAGNYTVFVPSGAVSKMTGQKRSNLIYLADLGFNCTVKTDNSLKEYEIIVRGCEY